MPSESLFPHKKKSMSGGNVTEDPRERNERKWREATNEVIVKNLADKIVDLLGGEVQYTTVVNSRGEVSKRIIISYTEGT